MKPADWERERERRIRRLMAVYREGQVGLVLGAGVTAASGVPTYAELVLRLLEHAARRKSMEGRRKQVRAFIAHERARIADGMDLSLSAAEIALFARSVLVDQGSEQRFHQILQECLYGRIPWWRDRLRKTRSTGNRPGRQIVQNATYGSNDTLNAILAFCSARSSWTSIARPYRSRTGRSREGGHVTNRKVAGVLTTNYDNLLEGATHTKFRRPLMKAVVRPASSEIDGRIPVYHIHGYVNFRIPDSSSGHDDTRAEDVAISEDDYFRVFYDTLGFGNYVSMGFLRRVPCIFIGCSLRDQNLRRFLFHLGDNLQRWNTPKLRHFAILPERSEEGDAPSARSSHLERKEVEDRILQEYGVEAIWIPPFDEGNLIPDILRRLYTTTRGIRAKDWDALIRERAGRA